MLKLQSVKGSTEDDSDNSEEYCTQIPCKKQASSQANPQRFRWGSEMVERLLKTVNLKTAYEFKGTDT